MSERQPGADLPGGSLRSWREDDVGDLLAVLRDPLVRHYSATAVDTPEQARAWLLRRRRLWGDGDGAGWAVCDSGGAVVGMLGFYVIDATLGAGSVGYALAPEGRGRGLASAAVLAGTRAVVAGLRWHRIELYHASENERSCAVAVRAGYPLEGTMREAMRYADGRWSDEHLHALLASDLAPADLTSSAHPSSAHRSRRVPGPPAR